MTVNAAVALVPEAVRATVPRVALPDVNDTVPDGALLPLAGLTVALKTVAPLCAMATGLAVTIMPVFTGGGEVTVRLTDAVDGEKLPAGE